MNNNLIIALFVVLLLVCVPSVFLYFTDPYELGIQIATAVYFVLVIGFMAYFHTQNRSKAALKKKLYEIEEDERAAAQAFILRNRQELLRKRGEAEMYAKKLKYEGLSRAERELLNDEEQSEWIEKMGIKGVKSASIL